VQKVFTKLTEEVQDVAISIQGLTRDFGNFTAVSDVSLDLPQGEIIGFLGPNGAGKSTTLKMVAGLIKPSEGKVFFRKNGELVQLNRGNRDAIFRDVGFLIENPDFYSHMTPRQILTYFAELKGYPRKEIKERVEEVVELVGMEEWIDKKIKTFSKGMRQKIGLVSALVHDPSVLILDEPQTGLDPKARKEVRDILMKLKAAGKTIFLSSHLLYEVSEISDKIAIINHGQLVAFDTVEKLEAKMKKSLLQIELREQPENIDEMIEKISKIIKTIVGELNGKDIVHFNYNLKVFEVLFDGNTENKHKILDTLIAKGIKIGEFSVPRTNLLESLYIGLMDHKKERKR